MRIIKIIFNENESVKLRAGSLYVLRRNIRKDSVKNHEKRTAIFQVPFQTLFDSRRKFLFNKTKNDDNFITNDSEVKEKFQKE